MEATEVRTPAEQVRAETLKTDAYRVGEDAARAAITTLRQGLVMAGEGGWGHIKVNTTQELADFKAVAKAQFQIVTQQALEDL